MSKKMLAILGSPHKKGATGKMLQYAVDIATKEGWHATWWFWRHLSIGQMYLLP